MTIVLAEGHKRKQREMSAYEKGSIVDIELHTGQVIRGEVKAIHETTSGRKVQVASGSTTMLVESWQIVKVIRKTDDDDSRESREKRRGK